MVKAPFPRLYLDTNVLIEAILESNLKWLKANPQEPKKLESIKSSLELYNNRQSLKLMTSAFSIAEFIAQGCRKEFGSKSFDEMLDIVTSKILPPNLDMIHTGLSFKQSPKIDKKWERYWLFAELKARGEAIDDKGTALGEMDFTFLLDLWGRFISGCGGGVPEKTDFKTFKPKITKINVSSYSAPAFEIMLFYKATEIAIDVGLKLPDAIHVLCAKGKADIIVTNDGDFSKKWQKTPRLLGISVKSSQKTLERLRKSHFI
jgi:predicted nucleic acid-binding protein